MLVPIVSRPKVQDQSCFQMCTTRLSYLSHRPSHDHTLQSAESANHLFQTRHIFCLAEARGRLSYLCIISNTISGSLHVTLPLTNLQPWFTITKRLGTWRARDMMQQRPSHRLACPNPPIAVQL